jgi:hypothetical protein
VSRRNLLATVKDEDELKLKKSLQAGDRTWVLKGTSCVGRRCWRLDPLLGMAAPEERKFLRDAGMMLPRW